MNKSLFSRTAKNAWVALGITTVMAVAGARFATPSVDAATIVCADDSQPETCVDWDALPDCANDASCNCKGNRCDTLPANECNEITWEYKYNPKCVRPKPNEQGLCPDRWQYQFKDCSAADRCQDPSVGNNPGGCGGAGGTGSNSSGVILYGQCNASSCPVEGCQNGYWYKTCCFINDQDGWPTPGC